MKICPKCLTRNLNDSDVCSKCGADLKRFLDIRVLDLSRVLAGPYCSMLLADMGADVIKLEIPRRGDDSREFPPFMGGESLYYVNLNRGKRSITIDLKRQEGRNIFIELVKRCDVLLENFRPGTMERLHLGYQQLMKVNPRLIYASISGFGKTGPYQNLPGYDIVGQAMGGLLSVTGWPNSPPTRVGTAIGDVLSALFCCIGILAALKVREQTGRGQLIDVALVDSVFASLENIPQKFFVNGEVPSRIGNRYEFVYPYDSFKASDGWIIIGIGNDSIWRQFIEVTGMTSLTNDERFASNPKRVENHETLKPLIEEWTTIHSVEHIISLLIEKGIPVSQIYTVRDVVEDPHISEARGMVVDMEQPPVGKVKLLGCPVKMSETQPMPKGPAPALGENTREILKEILSINDVDIKALSLKGVLG